LTNTAVLNSVKGHIGGDRFSTCHAKQVSRMATQLFDQLQPIHNMGNTEKIWLRTAALLHDIGKIRGRKMHHKHSHKMIVKLRNLPFSKKEKEIIGLIARYHRGPAPDSSHKFFGQLDSDSRRNIKKLAAILRLADGLCENDYIELLEPRCEVKKKHVLIRIKSSSILKLEKAVKKAKMFKDIFDFDIVMEINIAR
jgi:exopolyphosphatase/guanosine-5'-triphosphate,3'-diphosphate pyrophosphatase